MRTAIEVVALLSFALTAACGPFPGTRRDVAPPPVDDGGDVVVLQTDKRGAYYLVDRKTALLFG